MALNGNGRRFLRMNMHAREFCGATRNLAAHPYRGLARSVFAALLLCLQAGTSLAGPAPQAAWQMVSQHEILEAMRIPVGYDPTATTNAARFQADVLLHLARQAKARDPIQPLFLRRSDWFQAFLTRTGRTVENAPTYALLSYQHAQDIVVEYRTDHVIRKVDEGATPELALNVMLWWEATSDAPDGVQVTRVRAKKGFIGVTSTVTVYPDGRTEKDVPADRPDLAELEERLKATLEVEYAPVTRNPS